MEVKIAFITNNYTCTHLYEHKNLPYPGSLFKGTFLHQTGIAYIYMQHTCTRSITVEDNTRTLLTSHFIKGAHYICTCILQTFQFMLKSTGNDDTSNSFEAQICPDMFMFYCFQLVFITHLLYHPQTHCISTNENESTVFPLLNAWAFIFFQ